MKKFALITGSSSGIGAEFAKEFAAHGFDLVLIARNTKRLQALSSKLQSQYKINARIITKDLSDPQSAEQIFRQLQEEKVHVDILVNNAGFNVYGEFVHTDLEKEIQMIEVMVSTTTRLSKLFIKEMVASGKGKVLNVCSTGSFTPGPLDAVYQASKAFLLSFSEALQEELRGTGVTVTALCPGATKTEFARRANMEEVRLFNGFAMSAASVAKIGYKATIKGKRCQIPGLFNNLLVLSSRFSPKFTLLKTTKFLLSKS
jgi:short-subunit dehydrogenase